MTLDAIRIEEVDCDFMIVGAGSSGCVLASRLVRQGLKVLLLEKGSTDASSLAKLVRRPSDWMRQASSGNGVSEVFRTVPQAGLGGRRLPAFRGKGGGGTSNVNAALYCRGRYFPCSPEAHFAIRTYGTCEAKIGRCYMFVNILC